MFQFLLRRFAAARNYLLVEGPHVEHCRRLRIPRSIASFPTSNVGNLFRIRGHNALLRLLAVWDFPNTKQVADITRRRAFSTSRYSYSSAMFKVRTLHQQIIAGKPI